MNSEHRDGDKPSRRTVQHKIWSDEWMEKDVKEKNSWKKLERMETEKYLCYYHSESWIILLESFHFPAFWMETFFTFWIHLSYKPFAINILNYYYPATTIHRNKVPLYSKYFNSPHSTFLIKN